MYYFYDLIFPIHKKPNMKVKSLLLGSIALLLLSITSTAATLTKALGRQFYQLLIYHIQDKSQESRMDKFLTEAYIPALHRNGIKTVGVFKTLNIDTAKDKKVYVFLPFKSLAEFQKTSKLMETDAQLIAKGSDYINAAYNETPYLRVESVLMEAFAGMPELKKPNFSNPKSERVYELRSYESPTEKLYRKKVSMFDKEEVEIFDRIGSQPIFYGEVLSGSKMPNLMYITTYSNMESREAHWKTFGSDPKWKRVSALPEYQHVVSKADITFLTPADYSDL
jgi:hypothetical protein